MNTAQDSAIAFRRVVVAGLGISGKAAAEVLRSMGVEVLTADAYKAEADIRDFDAIDWSKVDALVVSPVFNPRTPFIVAAQTHHVPVISEVELAWRVRVNNVRTNRPAYWIGITGTNGKTSTTQMTSAMLTACGLDAPCVGNIGNAVCQAARLADHDVLCVELSSFQMHYTDSVALDCAVITNIAADHLDWHGSMQAYAADKAKVYRGVKKVLVYNADDPMVTHIAQQAKQYIVPGCRVVGVTLKQPQADQIGVKDGWIVDSGEKLIKLSALSHLCEPDGTVYPHLLFDAMVALALTSGVSDNRQSALAALRNFAPGDHRISTVAVAHDAKGASAIRFVDDSKATNAHAAHASLSSFGDHSVVWIAGGLAKGSHFEDLLTKDAHVMKAVVLIGADQRVMIEALHAQASNLPVSVVAHDGLSYEHFDGIDDRAYDMLMARTPAEADHSLGKRIMHKAIEAAGHYAEQRDVVLLAPACASMDQFVSYADRGNCFAQEAQQWVDRYEQQ